MQSAGQRLQQTLDAPSDEQKPWNAEDLTRRITKRPYLSRTVDPWFAIDHGTADEDVGAVWFGVLVWSGNRKLQLKSTHSDRRD
ncbi:MAG: hypothetical protein NVS4B8_19230 [Herpetosiphon sp.]